MMTPAGNCDNRTADDDVPEFRFSNMRKDYEEADPEIDANIPNNKTKNKNSNKIGSSKLYARQIEEEELVKAYRRCSCASTGINDNMEKQSELVLITGPSGTGKSRLAQSLQSHVEQNGGFWVSGKFDQLERPETSYPLIRAITDLVEQLLQRRNEGHDGHAIQIKVFDNLEEIANTENLLVDWIPALRQCQTSVVAIDTCQQQAAATMDAPKRLALALCRLIKAICSPEMPLVLFLDDVQWAKSAPLDLIRALISDTELIQKGGFMLLAACRGNEVPTEHHLSVTLRELEATGVQLTDIQLCNLDLTAVEEMVQDCFSHLFVGEQHSITSQLAQHIWDQSQGNIFFTIQLIRKIQQDQQQQQYRPNGRMRRNSSKKNLRQLLQQQQYTTAVDLITEMILRLPKDVQEVLKLASCFGAEFHPSLLEDLLLDFEIRETLEIAETEQLIVRCCSSSSSSSSATNNAGPLQGTTTTYRFLHDQIQQSAYNLIPPHEREAMHLEIGRRLWNELNEQELQQFGFAVVRQIRLGSSLIRDEKERYQVADLLLKAGIHATKTSAFDEAASHFELGISLLGRRHWKDEYFLSLDLYRWAAELAYCIGNHERVGTLTDQTIGNARIKRDKLGAYISRIESLTATNQPKLALQLALKVLLENGYKLPKKAGIATILYQLYKTKRKLKRYSNAQILRMPQIEDRGTLDMMKIFNLAIVNAVYADPMYFPIVAMMGVQTALKEGLCGASSVPCAAFAMLLCCHFGDVDLGFRLARLSLDIIDDRKAYQWQPRALIFVHGFVFPLKDSLIDQLEPLLMAHRQAIANGDIEMGMMAAHMQTLMAFHASLPLASVVSDMRMYLKVMEAHCQTIAIQYLLPTLQGAINLVQGSDQPGLLNGEVMNEEHFLKVQASDNAAADACMKATKLMVACVFGEYLIGEELAKDVPNWPMEGFSAFFEVSIFFYGGVSYAALAADGQTRERLAALKKTIQTLKKFVRHSKGRYDVQIQILEAEVEGIRGKTNAAITKFQKAIEGATRQGLHVLTGLANERASSVLLKAGQEKEAIRYLIRSIQAFQTWGAHAKVAQLVRRLPPQEQKPFMKYLEGSNNQPRHVDGTIMKQ